MLFPFYPGTFPFNVWCIVKPTLSEVNDVTAVLGEHSKYQQVNRSSGNFCNANSVSVIIMVMESVQSLLGYVISLTASLTVGGM